LISIPFIDLNSQYQDFQLKIKERNNRVLEHGQYIMSTEVIELEEKLQSYTDTQNILLRLRVAQRRS